MDPPSTLRKLLPAGLGLLGLLYALWGVCDTLTEMGGDSATYMLMARGLSPFVPADPALEQALAAASYPPLFPLMIGMLGGGFVAAHALVIGSLILGLALLYRLLRAWPLGPMPAAAVVALFAAIPGTYLLALNIWSENPCLVFSLLALLGLERDRPGEQGCGTRGWWIAVLGAAAAIMIRTAALPLILTVSLFVLRRRPRRWPWMLTIGWTPFLAWVLWSHLHASGGSQYAQQLMTLYAHDPAGHLRMQLQAEWKALVNAWLAAWLGYTAPHALILLIRLFGLLGLAGGALRLARGRADAIYVLLYLSMLLVWPWPGEAPRLLYGVLPLLLAYGLLAVQELSALLSRGGAALRLAAPVLLGLAVLPGVAVTMHERLAPVPAGLEIVRHIAGYYSDDLAQERYVAWAQAQLIVDMRRLSADVPAADCIFQIKPSVVQLLTGRRSVVPPLPATDDRTFAQQIGQCRYAYLMKLQSPTFPSPYYPLDRLAPRYQYHVIRQLQNVSPPNGGLLASLIELSPSQP